MRHHLGSFLQTKCRDTLQPFLERHNDFQLCKMHARADMRAATNREQSQAGVRTCMLNRTCIRQITEPVTRHTAPHAQHPTVFERLGYSICEPSNAKLDRCAVGA